MNRNALIRQIDKAKGEPGAKPLHPLSESRAIDYMSKMNMYPPGLTISEGGTLISEWKRSEDNKAVLEYKTDGTIEYTVDFPGAGTFTGVIDSE